MTKQIQEIYLTAKPITFEKLNSQLTRCRCYVVASGRNVNNSDITLDAIKKALPSLKNMPVVANLKKKDDDSGWCVGAHDVKIEWADDLEITDLTIPYGVVPESCNPTYEEILEPDGITKNTYLAVDIIIWSGRYNIMEAAYSEDIYFNQSCEILVKKSHYDDEYLVIDAFDFSALCMLGKDDDAKYNRIPCFPSCKIEKIVYSSDEIRFKEQFAELMQEVKKFSSVKINNTKNKEGEPLDVGNKSAIFEKVKSTMSEIKYRSGTDKHYNKYEILSVQDTSVNVLDREDSHKAYCIPFLATETKDGIVLNFDYDNKVEKSFILGDKVDAIFDFQKEITMISEDTAEFKVANHSSNAAAKFSSQIDEINAEFNVVRDENSRLKYQLAIFEKEKEAFTDKNHKDSIDSIVNTWGVTMGKDADFLEYASKLDYSKSIEMIETDIKAIHYKFMLKSKPNAAAKFSAIETNVVPSQTNPHSSLVEQYGEEFAKYFYN